MKQEYDFSTGQRGALISNKTRITIYIDDVTLNEFRSRAEQAGMGYQTMMNQALKDYLEQTSEAPLTESTLRKIIK